MQYIKPLADAMIAQDLSSIRAALITCVDLDAHAPQFTALYVADDVARKLKEKNIELFEKENSHIPLPSEPSLDDWNKVKAALRINFTREKIEYATGAAKKLREKNIPGFEVKGVTLNSQEKPVQHSVRIQHQPSVLSQKSYDTRFNKPLQAAIDAGDVSAARAAIITHADSDFFDGTANALEIADKVNDLLKEKGISLYMQDSGSISFSQTRWDESVWNRAKAALRVNFSREKILYITQLVKQHIPISPKKTTEDYSAPLTDPMRPTGGYKEPPRPSNHNHSRDYVRPQQTIKPMPRHKIDRQGMVITGVVVGAVIGGVVGVAVGATVTGVIIGGAVAAGVTICKK